MHKCKRRSRIWQKTLCMIGVLGILFTGLALLAAAKPPAGGVIAGKVYRLKNKGSGKYLNLCGGSDTTGKNINQFKDDGTDTLKWRFIEGTGDYVNAFKIQPILSSTRVVDVQRKGQPIASGGNIQLYSATDDISQHFVFKDTGDGDKSVYICPYTNQNVYMTANGDSNGTHSGTSETSAGNVFVKSSTGTNYQKWFVEETQANPTKLWEDVFYIRNQKSDLYMGITSSYNVEQQNFTGASTQKWMVSYDSDGYYTLKIKSNTNYRLDVDNAWDDNGTNIKVMTYTGYDAQLFRIIPNGDGTYRISPKHSTLRVVDVNGGYTTAGANIHLWNYVNAAQQKWSFVPVDRVNLWLYQTLNTTKNDENDVLAEDLKYSFLSRNQLLTINHITESDLNRSVDGHRSGWTSLCHTTSTEPLQSVLDTMVSRFMEGSGADFSNSDLTAAAQNHTSTQAYINTVKDIFQKGMSQYNGDVYRMFYSKTNRDDTFFVKELKSRKQMQPVFNTAGDTLSGLTMAVNGLWGNSIKLKSINRTGHNYTAVLSFHLYDHFGLDKKDVEKYGTFQGFRDWYILQCYSGYLSSYRPFVTNMEFDIYVSGTI